jgi:hypothetical protein
MANTTDKRFILFHNMDESLTIEIRNFIENKMSTSYKEDSTHFIHWMRLWGGHMYIIGTVQGTKWTSDKIVNIIKKNIIGTNSLFVIELKDSDFQGWMDQDAWKFLAKISDLTKVISDNTRANKLKNLKELIKKKEDLKRKEIELKNKEVELLKKKEFIDQEAILLEKEKQLKQMEDELLNREKIINDLKEIKEIPKERKKFLGIF